MKVLLIGPFPLPIDGCSYANKILQQNFVTQRVAHDMVNTNTSVISSKQGNKFSFKKAFSFIPVYLGAFKIFSNDVVYLTPGQTFFGIVKYSPFILLCILLNKPYVIHVHGNYLGKQYQLLTGVKKKIFHFLLSRCAAGIVLSKSLVHNFDDLLPLDKVFVVENFVDDTLYATVPQKPVNKLVIIYLSNLMREKGILDVLDALLLLQKANIPFEATIAGSMEVGIKPEIESRLQHLGSSVNYVNTITGDKKKQKLQEANVFILPTYYKMEGQPISLLEGLATGNIIISTQHAGIPDIINEKNGYLVKPQSPAEIADCLRIINADITGNVEKFSAFNRSYAAATFTEKRFFENIFKVLKLVAK
ncbi:glycosyltransferase family 4 protein [Mucilaginibacter sp. CSA2-8R]|uniref:glycosyltransferase family 4 protein n=1 Tax=Mucilaginibacter sp. CSA2-8R TaxID=3141542 RepID=UPI00315D2389